MTCIARLYGMALLLLCVAVSVQADIETPYGEVSLPYELHKLPGVPVYYIVGLSGVPDPENEGHTANAGFVVTDDGVVVYDAGGTPAVGYMLLKRMQEVTDKPVKIVIAGHYHADHIYGLQAFKEHTKAEIWAHETGLDYLGGDDVASTSEDSQSRLEQRREVLFPWVDENTYLVAPDKTFEQSAEFKLGGLTFSLVYMGPAHSPSDSIMVVKELGVIFGGDILYSGRVPFLDSPQTDTGRWLEGLDYLVALEPAPKFIIPGHGEATDDPRKAVQFTRQYIEYMRTVMGQAAGELIPFDEAYADADWSAYEDLPAFTASNRGNAYRIYLEMEAAGF